MILLIHAHPDPESFTRSLADAVRETLLNAGHEVVSVDLYHMSDGSGAFPAALTLEELRRKSSLEPIIQKQMSLVEQAQTYVIIHPDWWGGPPAVLKGWVDRVLRPGTAYETPEGFGEREPEGLLGGRKALVVVTGDNQHPGSLETLWVDRIWGFCGVHSRFYYLGAIRTSSRTQRIRFLEEIQGAAEGLPGTGARPDDSPAE